MQGIRFVTDEQGKKVGVLIDLAVHGDLWEDFYDHLLMNERAGEPEDSLETVRGRLVSSSEEWGPFIEDAIHRATHTDTWHR